MEQQEQQAQATFNRSLRLRVAFGVALPVLLMLSALSWIHYVRERSLLEEYTRTSAAQIGEATLGSLRHVMLEKDEGHLNEILRDVGKMENIQRLMLIDLDGQVAADSQALDPQAVFSTADLGCQECHQLPPQSRERATILATQETTLRISTPIDNEPACQTCHGAPPHLGMLLIDVSLVDTRAHLLRDLSLDMLISLAFTVLITLGAYYLVHSLIVKRVLSLEGPLTAMAAGDFSLRLPSPARARDELAALTQNVNRMADDLERYVAEREQVHQTRYQAMLEERERIAREMHDGVAQLMGFVHTKSSAIRLQLKQGQQAKALEQLDQLATASQEGALEIRTNILGLRARDLGGGGIHQTLRIFLQKFQELTGLIIEADLPEADEGLNLSPEGELHVLRIAQEALTNIHKHARAGQAYVALQRINGQVELRIRDLGVGFEPQTQAWQGQFTYGLKSMRERAAAIGATLEILTQPEQGTEIILRIPREGA